MKIAPEVIEFDAKVKEAGVPVAVVLKRAGVAHTTWYRWMEGRFDPRAATLRSLRAALETEVRERSS